MHWRSSTNMGMFVHKLQIILVMYVCTYSDDSIFFFVMTCLLEFKEFFLFQALAFANSYGKPKLGFSQIYFAFEAYLHWKQHVVDILNELQTPIGTLDIVVERPEVLSESGLKSEMNKVRSRMNALQQKIETHLAFNCTETIPHFRMISNILWNRIQTSKRHIFFTSSAVNQELSREYRGRLDINDHVSMAIRNIIPGINGYFVNLWKSTITITLELHFGAHQKLYIRCFFIPFGIKQNIVNLH